MLLMSQQGKPELLWVGEGDKGFSRRPSLEILVSTTPRKLNF